MKFSVFLKRYLFLGAALSLVGGCSSVEPRYYSLAPVPGSALNRSFAGAQGGIKVFTASIPVRLDRDVIVQGVQDYRLQLTPASSWSEPLGDMISQTLVADLSQRFPGRVITAQNQSVALEPSEFIDVAIQNFERNAQNHVVIRGVISVRKQALSQPKASDLKPDIKSSEAFEWISPQAVPADTASFVASLSQGVAAMADKLVATML